MTRRHHVSFAAGFAGIALVVLGFAGRTSAAPFMDINFNADTVGNAPATGASSNPVNIPWAIGGYDSDPLPVADPGYKSPPTPSCGTTVVDNAGGMTKGAHLTTNSTDGEQGALWIDTQFGQAGQQIRLSFDLNVLAAPTTATAQIKTLNGTGSAGIIFGENTFGTGQGARFAVAPTSAGGGVFAIRSPDNTDLQSFFNYNEGTAYHVDLFSDYDTGFVTTYVNGVNTGALPFATGPQAGVTTQEFFMHLNGESGFANELAIDNIVAAVPEPASLGLFAMAAVSLLARRSRR